MSTATRRSPTPALLVGLVITVASVVGYSWQISGQIARLRQLQTDLTDRNRRASVQLLRIQNDLNQLGIAMRDMLEAGQRYPLIAWSAQFERIRRDLSDAVAQEQAAAAPGPASSQRQYLASALEQFWASVDRMFGLAGAGQHAEARTEGVSLQERQATLTTAVATLLRENSDTQARTAEQVQEIYRDVQRQAYWFLAVTLAAIVVTSLYLMRFNRRLFAELAALSDERRELARTLISTRESTLREIARELHDEFGQLLTAMGSMLGRAGRQLPADSTLKADLREISEVAQSALDNVRGLSQTLHPSILEELGLDSAISWYLSTVERQLGIQVRYERHGTPVPVNDTTAIHVYRVLQEAVSNVARHAGASEALVRLTFEAGTLTLEVEDHGAGLPPGQESRGLGLIAMRERAELLGGTIEFLRPAAGGTQVRLRVPAPEGAAT